MSYTDDNGHYHFFGGPDDIPKPLGECSWCSDKAIYTGLMSGLMVCEFHALPDASRPCTEDGEPIKFDSHGRGRE